jgi:hypothetical protein
MGLTQYRGGQVTAMSSMLAGIFSYGFLNYVVQYEYAYLMSLVCALLSFFVLMWFEADQEQSPEPVTQPVA